MTTLRTIALLIGYAWLACLALSLGGFAAAWLFAPRRTCRECRGCSRCGEPFFAHEPREWECISCREAEAAGVVKIERKAVTGKIREEYQYTRYPVSPGEALHIEESKDGYFVEWGEKPEAQDDVPFAAAKPEPVLQVPAEAAEVRQPGEPAMF